MYEFTLWMCVPGGIDLYGAASQTCLPEWTEDHEMRKNGNSYCTAWLPGTFGASVALVTQHRLSLEGDNKTPCRRRELV